MKIELLPRSEYPDFTIPYINAIPRGAILGTGIVESKKSTIDFFQTIPEISSTYRYAQEKWSISEVIQHIIDTERIFAYRLLRLGRGDQTALAGFDQDDYLIPSQANQKSMKELIKEYSTTRDNSISVLNSLSDKYLLTIGNVGGYSISARALGFLIHGHELHHIKVLKDRYL